jgi:perosamine synthetase
VTQGPRVAAFEEKFAAYVGCDHAVAVSSCTTGLHLAMVVNGISAGDEVICPSLSFIATANSIAYTGATPVFCDVDPVTFNLAPERIEELITPRTKAILVVHQIGCPADLEPIAEIAARRNLILLEDAACAIGSEYQNRRIGLPVGQMAIFSFHPRKIVTTCEGGMITTQDPELAARLRKLRQHAMSVSDVVRHSATQVTAEGYDEIGYNYRMTDLHAAVGLCQLDRLPDFLLQRRALAARYDAGLSHLDWLQTPVIPHDRRSNYQSYIVRMLRGGAAVRDGVMQQLLEKGISTRRAIMAIHREPPYRDARWDTGLPNTELVTDSGMILPLFHDMTKAEQDYTIEALQEIQPRD